MAKSSSRGDSGSSSYCIVLAEVTFHRPCAPEESAWGALWTPRNSFARTCVFLCDTFATRRERGAVQFVSYPVLILQFLSYPMTISATSFDTHLRARHTRGPVARSSLLFRVLSVAFWQLAGQLRTLVRAFHLARLSGGILVLDKAPFPNQAAPARIVFQDRGELAEFQKGRSGRDIGPSLNSMVRPPSGRHLWCCWTCWICYI